MMPLEPVNVLSGALLVVLYLYVISLSSIQDPLTPFHPFLRQTRAQSLRQPLPLPPICPYCPSPHSFFHLSSKKSSSSWRAGRDWTSSMRVRISNPPGVITRFSLVDVNGTTWYAVRA